MAVKLYNLSGLPDEPMRALLVDAMRLAGATGSVVVKVTKGGGHATSYAKSAIAVYAWFLLGQRYCRKTRVPLKRTIKTNGGYVVMKPHRCWRGLRVPCATSPTGYALKTVIDGLAMAQDFFKTAVHEFAHVYDFQHDWGQLRWSAREAHNGRRAKWSKRPEEIRAVNRTDDALKKLLKQPKRKARIDDRIIDLGIQMEARMTS